VDFESKDIFASKGTKAQCRCNVGDTFFILENSAMNGWGITKAARINRSRACLHCSLAVRLGFHDR
jgi:hypothetical protein